MTLLSEILPFVALAVSIVALAHAVRTRRDIAKRAMEALEPPPKPILGPPGSSRCGAKVPIVRIRLNGIDYSVRWAMLTMGGVFGGKVVESRLVVQFEHGDIPEKAGLWEGLAEYQTDCGTGYSAGNCEFAESLRISDDGGCVEGVIIGDPAVPVS